MAGDWMKVELELPDKPEVHSIAGTLAIDPDMVVGKLIRVWQWFDKHTTDGNAFGVTYSLIDRITLVTGFGEAMMLVGWLEQNDKFLSMPKFERHTSKSAKTRALTGSRVKKHRLEVPETCNDVSVTKSLPEKRREENKNISSLARFDEFWAEYPATHRRTAKPQCKEKWAKENLDEIADQIIAHVKEMKQTESWKKGFMPCTLTYINQARWDGWQQVPQKPKPNNLNEIVSYRGQTMTRAEMQEIKDREYEQTTGYKR